MQLAGDTAGKRIHMLSGTGWILEQFETDKNENIFSGKLSEVKTVSGEMDKGQ